MSENNRLAERIKEIRVDIAELEKGQIKSALLAGDLETAEALMIDLKRRELCQVYLDKMEAEESEESDSL